MTTLEVSNYVTLPSFDVRGGFALGVALLIAVPASAPEVVKDAARGVRTSVVALQEGWSARSSEQPLESKPADQRVDKAWGALRASLAAAQSLTGTAREVAATLVLDFVLPDGLGFLNLRFPREWAESERRLQMVATPEWEERIRLATGGPEFLDELRAAHAHYGQVLGITGPAAPAEEVNLTERLRELRAAIKRYALQVVAWSSQDGVDSSVAGAALLPIDAARGAETRRPSSVAPEVPELTPDAPVPAIP
jgi:hypothetical protein